MRTLPVEDPVRALNGRIVRITGHLEAFRDQPQIFLQNASQIRVKAAPGR